MQCCSSQPVMPWVLPGLHAACMRQPAHGTFAMLWQLPLPLAQPAGTGPESSAAAVLQHATRLPAHAAGCHALSQRIAGPADRWASRSHFHSQVTPAAQAATIKHGPTVRSRRTAGRMRAASLTKQGCAPRLCQVLPGMLYLEGARPQQAHAQAMPLPLQPLPLVQPTLHAHDRLGTSFACWCLQQQRPFSPHGYRIQWLSGCI